jgi:predicted nucleic acid-binding protein
MLRVYTDNDVASAVTRGSTETRDKAEVGALDQLLRWNAAGQIILATSRQSPREMEQAPIQYQSALKKGLHALEIAKDDHIVLGSSTITDPYGGFITNPIVTDIVDQRLYDLLLATGLGADDAKHLMYAVHNGYERFLTWNRKDFLNRKAKLEGLCPSIKIQKPSELVAELSTRIKQINVQVSKSKGRK